MKIEMIEEYLHPEDGGDYKWNDNHGVLIRCRDCRYYEKKVGICGLLSNNYMPPVSMDEDDYCSKGARNDE